MYAISSVNEGKYRVLSDSLVAAFRGTPKTIHPVEVGEKLTGAGADLDAPRPVVKPTPDATKREQLSARAQAAVKALRSVADQVESAMQDLVKADMVVVRRNDFWIEVEIRTDLLFPSAGAQLSNSAAGVIERLANVLAPLPNAIRVEGHTDNRPINTVAFYSNWELSAARAASVVRVLAGHGVAPARLAVIGYGEQRPTHPNTTLEGRNANRRVVMVILSTESAPPPLANGTVPAP
jgi:chemotaxis protein MotB